MAKRAATSALNQDNWDQEDEPEEPQVFQKASAEVLESRVIRTAKRRIRVSDVAPDAKPSPFSGFAGFGKPTSTSSADSPFSFLNQTKAKTDDKDKNGTGQEKTGLGLLGTSPASQAKPSLATSTFTFGIPPKDTTTTTTTTETGKSSSDTTFKPFEHIFKGAKQTSQEPDKKSQNLELLKDLNLSCSSWIAKHLEKNPYCILTPIFNDYKKHLDELNLDNSEVDKNKGDSSGEPEKPANKSNSQIEMPSSKPFTFSKEESLESGQGEKKEPEKPAEFKFGGFQPMKPFNLQFDNVNTSFKPAPSPFSLNAIAAKPVQPEEEKKDDEESDEPPKNEFVPVVEEDSIFDMKCKVFVKKEDQFVSRGVGTLFLKPVKDSGKTQMVVRAHTSLGNILLNVLLSAGMPIRKNGKNNAMIVCIPTPEAAPPPVPVLIRVKTSEECDTLIKKLEECRGS